MRLRDAARGRLVPEARLLLAARGVATNPRALAGAMLEVEHRAKVGAMIDGLGGNKT